MGLNTMDIFGSVEHNDDNSDKWPALPDNPTSNDLLDYMVMIIARELESEKAFKGGYMMNQLLGGYSRMTHDVDFSIEDKEVYESIIPLLEHLGDFFVKQGVAASYKVKPTIEATMSGGFDVYADDGRKILGMDIGLHDLSYGIQNYNITVGEVKAFSVERMLSDKLLAILSRKRFRRTKDLYDFYVITNFYDVDMKQLAEFIENRGTAEWDNIPFSDVVLEQYAKCWQKLNLTSYTDKVIDKPDFNLVVNRFYNLALPLKEGVTYGRWNHQTRQYEK